jgi:hypothetical protein
MADRTRIYKSTDWQVWTYVPEPDSFILNKSKLDVDSLGSAGGTMTPNTSKITNINISEGGSVNSGLFTSIESASLSLGLNIKNYSVVESEKYYIGSPIWVTLKNEETVPEKRYGLNTPIFVGKITAFNAPVIPGEDFTEVTIQASSNTADMLNMLLSVKKGTVEDKFYYLDEAAYVQYPPVFYENKETQPTYFVDFRFCEASRLYNFANSNTESKTIGEWLTDYNNCELWVATDSTKPDRLRFRDGSSSFVDYVTGPQLSPFFPAEIEVKNTYDSSDIYSCVLDWSGANSPTGVNLSLASDDSVSYQFGTTQNNLSSSAFLYTGTLDVKDIDQLQQIGQNMLSVLAEYTATEISVEIARPGREIIFKDLGQLGTPNIFLEPKNLAYAGNQIKIDLPDFGISNQIMIITGRQIEVTPETFNVTYNLWKGFTN